MEVAILVVHAYAIIKIATLFYLNIFFSPVIFGQIKSGLLQKACHFLMPKWNLCSKAVFLVRKHVFLAISLNSF
jgi:hypothetical protein